MDPMGRSLTHKSILTTPTLSRLTRPDRPAHHPADGPRGRVGDGALSPRINRPMDSTHWCLVGRRPLSGP